MDALLHTSEKWIASGESTSNKMKTIPRIGDILASVFGFIEEKYKSTI